MTYRCCPSMRVWAWDSRQQPRIERGATRTMARRRGAACCLTASERVSCYRSEEQTAWEEQKEEGEAVYYWAQSDIARYVPGQRSCCFPLHFFCICRRLAATRYGAYNVFQIAVRGRSLHQVSSPCDAAPWIVELSNARSIPNPPGFQPITNARDASKVCLLLVLSAARPSQPSPAPWSCIL